MNHWNDTTQMCHIKSAYPITVIGGQNTCTTLMRQIDTKLKFSEIVLNSTTVLGFEADTELISSIPGLLVAGCSVAFPGFAGTDFDYSDNGWFIG